MSFVEARIRPAARKPAAHGPRIAAITVAVGLAGAIVASFALSVAQWTPAAWAALPLVALTGLWISGGAATALLGRVIAPPAHRAAPAHWHPLSRTAILVTLCKENPEPLAHHLAALRTRLDRAGMGDATRIFVLSDTAGGELVVREEAALHPLRDAGVLAYRRREQNIGRKPGNIADWLASHGARFDHMLVLDADSRMTPTRIRDMIWQMDHRPGLGLLQAGIALLPGASRFSRHQRTGARLLSRGFGRGIAAWSGDSGNYWGHNALIRIAAFRSACALPVLSGTAPFGGPLLSHDFIEAAWIRRAGWAVALDPDTAGSAEAAPETLAEFHARDRRWCQGNLQHLRLIAEPDLDPVSRVHLALGVLSYLVAPIWLVLVALISTGAVPVASALPLLIVAFVLLLPKLCALSERWRGARTLRRRGVLLRAAAGELIVSSLIAPLMMVRQAGAVASVLAGRDCGWKSERPRLRLPAGLAEAMAGAGLVVLAALASGPSSALWLAPVALPLCLAPLIADAMNRRA